MHTVFISMMFHKYHRVSLFFLLCSSSWIMQNNCLWVHCFFCLINCALAAFVWKLSVHFILKIQNLSCSFKTKKLSLFDVSFCPCIIFQILFICLSVLSYSSLDLWWLIFLSGSLYISIFGCLPQRFILFLWWYLVSLILYVPWSLGIAVFASEEVAISSCVNQLALGDKSGTSQPS